MPGMPGMMPPQPTPVMLLDAASSKLFVLVGNRLFMYSTTDLKLLGQAELPGMHGGMRGAGPGGPQPGGPPPGGPQPGGQ
jgi:hypothetical protein